MKREIFKLAIPAALSNLLDTLQLLIDILMIGKVSPEAIGAVGLSGQLIILIYSFISIFYIGTNALVSRAFGEKKPKKAEEVIFSLLLISLVFSIPIFIYCLWFSDTFFKLMGVDREVLLLGESYIEIIAVSIPFLFIGAVLHSGLTASGDTRTPFYISIFTNGLNTFLNYCLIFGNFGFPRLEVQGAAIATTVSYVLEVLIFLFIFLKGSKGIKLTFTVNKEAVKKGLNIGIPAGLEKFISFFSFLIFVKIITGYGVYTLAGYQIGLRIEALAFMPGIGFATAAMVLVGYYLGANKPEKAEYAVKETLKLSAVFMGILGVLFVVIPEFFVKLFTSDPDTVREASLYLQIVGISQIPLAIDFVLNGALKGAGATRATLIINNLSFWIFRIVPAFIVSHISEDIMYIYIIMILETFIKAGILWKIFKMGKWKLKKI
ncbi:MATE family efflux transporter [Persephonella sp.]